MDWLWICFDGAFGAVGSLGSRGIGGWTISGDQRGVPVMRVRMKKQVYSSCPTSRVMFSSFLFRDCSSRAMER